jgi:PIN domain nuclease of toxin-antitoxin system
MTTSDRGHLLDTHTFLWMTSAPDRLGPEARAVIEDPAARVVLSVASVWEMAIQRSLGKLDLPAPLPLFLKRQLHATRTSLLDVRAEPALEVDDLPWHHRDPFDRLLAAQARFEGLILLSRDTAFDGYGISRTW